MKFKLNITTREANRIKNGEQVMLLVPKSKFEDQVQYFDEIELDFGDDNLVVKVTGVSLYSSLEDAFKIVPFSLFFDQGGETETLEYYNNEYSEYNGKFYSLRVKSEKEGICEEIQDEELLSLININTLEPISVGNSVTKVYKVDLKEGGSAILKTQSAASRVTLEDEYKRLLWLQGKVACPKLLYYSKNGNQIYMLIEKVDGKVCYEFKEIGYSLGSLLKSIHSLDISECEFKENSVSVLLEKAIEKVHYVIDTIKEIYPDETEESIIKFLKENQPEDDAVVHGDFCLPNIIRKDDGEMKVIDVGDLSVSTKYYDFFHFMKSLRINKMEDEIIEFKKGYGIDDIEERFLKWMTIIDEILF